MELLVVTLSAVLVNLITEISKRWNMNPRYVVLVLSIILGALWYMFQAFVPQVFQVEVENFVAGTATGAVFLYEFFTKHIK